MGDKSVSNIQISSLLPFGLPFPSDSYYTLTTRVNSEPVTVDVYVKERTSGIPANEPKPFPVPSVSGNDMRMNIDRFGQVSVTYIRFRFNVKPERRLSDIEYNEELINYYLDKALASVNKIVDACRMVSDIYCPRNITETDLVSFKISCYDTNGKNLGNIFKFGRDIDEDRTAFFLVGYTLKKEKVNALKDILTRDTIMSLDEELLTSAKDYFLFKNYRIACIETQSAVESTISFLIRKHLSTMHKSEEEITQVLSNRLDDMKPYLNEISTTISGGSEWKNWKEKCYQVRNNVVHKGVRPNRKEAKDALESGKKFIEFLRSFV